MLELGILPAAALGAFAFGGGDMLGACASRRLSCYNAAAVSQVAAVSAIYLVMPPLDFAGVAAAPALVCLAGGLAHAIALMLLYLGLARGSVGIVAPLCAMSSIVLPLLGDLATGRPLSDAQIVGISLCALAALLIAGSSDYARRRRPVGWSASIGIASGMSYGAADVMLATVPIADATTVVFLARCACVAFALAVALLMYGAAVHAAAAPGDSRSAGRIRAPARGLVSTAPLVPHLGLTLAAAAGLFDVIGQLGYMTAATQGSMGVASAITALFPAVTVLLAVILFRERISGLQMIGYALASSGVLVLAT
jgi:drug/metabolite transporter (DMT)-like permease